jgi:salicylate hydroxylase
LFLSFFLAFSLSLSVFSKVQPIDLLIQSKILEQSSLLQETGAAITITPNASRVLRLWDFNTERSRMVAISTGSLLNGTTMEVVMPNYLQNIEEMYGTPLYSVHRVDLHNQLRLLATQKDGPGSPVDIQVLAKVVDYVSEDDSRARFRSF